MFRPQIALNIKYSIYNCLKPELSTRICTLYNGGLCTKNSLLFCVNRNYAKGTVQDKDILTSGSEDMVKNVALANGSNEICLKQFAAHRRKRKPSQSDILKLYPQPLCILQNIYQIVANEMGETNHLRLSHHKKPDSTAWTCTCTLSWPEKKTFSTEGRSKQAASTTLALECLAWLHNTGKIKNRKPILVDKEKAKDVTHTLVDINIEPTDLQEIQNLLNIYDCNIKDKVNGCPNTTVEDSCAGSLATENFHSPRDVLATPTVAIIKRNETLLQKLDARRWNEQTDLPIFSYREQILDELEKNQVLLIKGDTGCGKTTQVPQFIMDAFTAKRKATDCNMIISQPRRISATSISMRVAQERGEHLGDVVGYRVRLEKVAPHDRGSMLFCTTGILLRMLQDDPSLGNYSHVILDEAHERSIETDMLLVFLKRAVQKNPSLKLIVMSATLNAHLFQNYFNCPVVDVPGRLHPVTMHFLEDMEKISIVPNYYKNGRDGHLDVSELCAQVLEVVEWICLRKPPGAILCFLPGWAEISTIQQKLLSNPVVGNNLAVVAAHSRLPTSNQRMIFDTPPAHIRKIILATDIAETGITVPDVRYVVDSCIRRDMFWHDSIMLPSIDNIWVSRANIHQRKGRAGRVQPGESYHLISREMYEKLDSHPMPEIMRASLDEPILEIMNHNEENVRDFLRNMPDPPKSTNVDNSINNLKSLGALSDDERLTPLGKRIAYLAINPKLGKAIIYSTIFRCVDPIVVIASLFDKDNDIFSEMLTDKPSVRRTKRKYHPSSDHLALYWLYMTWKQYENRPTEMKEFCRKLLLNFRKLETITKEAALNIQSLQRSKMLHTTGTYDSMYEDLNKNSHCDELVRAVLLAGTNFILHHKKCGFKKGRLSKNAVELRGNNGIRATITTDSVNHKRTNWPSTFLTYVQGQHSHERRTTLIRETSILTPLSVILFSQGKVFLSEGKRSDDNTEGTKVALQIEGITNVSLNCDKEIAEVLLKLRESMWSIVAYLVRTQGIDEVLLEDELEEVRGYNKRFFNVITKILNAAAVDIQNESLEKESASDDDARSD